jgi:hypothetical protein
MNLTIQLASIAKISLTLADGEKMRMLLKRKKRKRKKEKNLWKS